MEAPVYQKAILEPYTFVFRTKIPAQSWRLMNQGIEYGRSPIMDDLPLVRAWNEEMRAKITFREWARRQEPDLSELPENDLL
jgi:hypothetical protein